MVKKTKRIRPETTKKDRERPAARMWSIISAVALIVSLGMIASLVFSQSSNRSDKTNEPVSAVRPAAPAEVENDARVQLVASKFRCACGGCGELPLDECTCTMPKGAAEEKAFIQKQLSKGLTIDQVIREVDKEYGHRKAG